MTLDRVPLLLMSIYNSLDNLINGFPQAEQKTINKFVCQLFFLIFFTNKFDIKSGNILVQTDNHNMEFIHIDFDDICGREGMFDTFENNEICNLQTEKLFLKSLWKRISSNELSEYFNEYVKKYTLTEEKLKKIISRTVKNVFRQNYDIRNGKPENIQSDKLKQTCRYSFIRMQGYMQYMLDQLSQKKILLQGGDEQKKLQLMNVLKENRDILDNMLKNNTIETCVDESIKRYEKLKEELLKEKQQKQLNKNIDNHSNPSTPSNNDSFEQNNNSNINNNLNLNDNKKEINDSNINEQEKSLNISGNVSLSYSSSSVKSNNKSNINNELNLNDNLNNDINLNDSKKEINDSKQNHNRKNGQMTSCGEILSNIKDFFTKCCSNCETNNSTDVNIDSLQVGNTRNINQ